MRMRLSVTTGTNVQAISENAPVNPALSSAGMSLLRSPPRPHPQGTWQGRVVFAVPNIYLQCLVSTMSFQWGLYVL